MGERLCSKPSGKCSVERNRLRKNTYVPSRRLSDYGIQLKEKQKARIIYGVMEKQFRGYVNKASKMEGIAGENLLSLLESRLDNVVFRLGLGRSRAQSRQLVSHGHFLVNGRKVNVPSYLVRNGDKVEISEKSKKSEMFKTMSLDEEMKDRNVPDWLKSDKNNGSGDIISKPETDDMEIGIQTRLIIEYYSRR
ncbi:MAG: 30S ribosomal protein S4 [Chloroflexi bacterium]|nr:30S ribosomal protein S4 [Chloroflexota bacterium]|tara:strand:- start:9874 stop:10452 length:579 start_codon:yes stop_codon:yes gene_type:complete